MILDQEQIEAIEKIKNEIYTNGRTGAALVGAEMGTGKTIIAVEAMRPLLESGPCRVLIVGPRDTGAQWIKAINDRTENRFVKYIKKIDTTARGGANLAQLLNGDAGIYYSGLEILRTRVDKKTLKRMPLVDLLISDEVHTHSNSKTISAKTMGAISAIRKIALSGTFFGNKFENAHTVTRWLWPEVRDPRGFWVVDPSKAEWLSRWGKTSLVVSKSGRPLLSKRGALIRKIEGERDPGAFVASLPCYVFLKSPVGKPPPPDPIYVEMSGEQERQYKEMEEKSLAWMRDKTGQRVALVADLPIVKRGRLRTAALGEMVMVPGEDETADSIEFSKGCRSNKLNALGRLLLQDPDWVGRRVLILTHSKRFAEETARRMLQKTPGSVGLKTGDTGEKDWLEIKGAFMAPLTSDGSIQYLVAVISAVGTGTDGLQANCSRVVWLSRDDSAKDMQQAMNRIWRRGVDKEDYRAVEFMSRGTIDTEVAFLTTKKMEDITASTTPTTREYGDF